MSGWRDLDRNHVPFTPLSGPHLRDDAHVSSTVGLRTRGYFVTTFALSWSVWVPLMLIRVGVIPTAMTDDALVALALPGVLMPAVAATWLTGRELGWAGVRRLYGRLGRWRIGRWWWVALLLQPLVLVVTAVLYNQMSDGDRVEVESGLTAVSVMLSLTFLVLASCGEELGWRGHALPRLLARHGASRASGVLGLATATWHLPYWVLQGVLADYGWPYLVLDYGFVLALTFQLTWLFNRAGGSVLAAVGFHVSFNLVNVTLLPVTGIGAAFALLTIIEVGVAVAVSLRKLRSG
jgi:CAAX protease family protein